MCMQTGDREQERTNALVKYLHASLGAGPEALGVLWALGGVSPSLPGLTFPDPVAMLPRT